MTKNDIIEFYENTIDNKKKNNKDWKDQMVVFWGKNTVYCYHRYWADDINYSEIITKIFPGKLVDSYDWSIVDFSKVTRCETSEYVLKVYNGIYLAMEDA